MGMVNKKEYDLWLKERMNLGYSFVFIKGLVQVGKNKAEMVNKYVRCVNTDETMEMIWYKE